MDCPKECNDIFPNSEKVFHLERLRFADNKEMVVVNTFVPYEKFWGIETENFEQDK